MPTNVCERKGQRGERYAWTPIKAAALEAVALALMACALATPAFAVEEGQAAYINGTSSGVAPGTIGSLDTTSATVLAFKASPSGGSPVREIDVPYAGIHSFRYYTELARHLGVLPGIAVSLVRHRERKHFFAISYYDSGGAIQTVLFEVAKHDPPALLEVLRARSPQACVQGDTNCGATP